MWLTGCSTTLKGFLIAEKPANTPATCWRPATSDTLSTRSPSLNSVTTSSETCVAVSSVSASSPGFATSCCEKSGPWILNLVFLSLRYDPPVSARPWRFQRGCFRPGHPPPAAPSWGSPLAYGSTLPVPHSTPVRPAAALPRWTRGWKRRKPAQWWVQLARPGMSSSFWRGKITNYNHSFCLLLYWCSFCFKKEKLSKPNILHCVSHLV